MYPIPDDVFRYVIVSFLLPKDIIRLVCASKYHLKQITYPHYKFHYYNHAMIFNKMCREILNLSKCIAYINGDPEFIDGILVRMSQGKNIKCIKNRTYQSSFCSRHEKLWYEDDTTDEWWVPLQM